MFSSIVNLNCYGNLHPRFILIAWRWFNLPFWKCVISNPPKGDRVKPTSCSLRPREHYEYIRKNSKKFGKL